MAAAPGTSCIYNASSRVPTIVEQPPAIHQLLAEQATHRHQAGVSFLLPSEAPSPGRRKRSKKKRKKKKKNQQAYDDTLDDMDDDSPSVRRAPIPDPVKHHPRRSTSAAALEPILKSPYSGRELEEVQYQTAAWERNKARNLAHMQNGALFIRSKDVGRPRRQWVWCTVNPEAGTLEFRKFNAKLLTPDQAAQWKGVSNKIVLQAPTRRVSDRLLAVPTASVEEASFCVDERSSGVYDTGHHQPVSDQHQLGVESSLMTQEQLKKIQRSKYSSYAFSNLCSMSYGPAEFAQYFENKYHTTDRIGPWLCFVLRFVKTSILMVCHDERIADVWFQGIQALGPLSQDYLPSGLMKWDRLIMKLNYYGVPYIQKLCHPEEDEQQRDRPA